MSKLPLLLHSVSYSGSWGQAALPLEAFLQKAAELGFDGVMLMAKRPHLSLLDYDSAKRKALKVLLASEGLRHNIIAGYTNFTADLEHAEIPQREMQIAHVEQLAALAAGIDAGVVRIFTGYEHPAAPYQLQWNLVVEAIRECGERAERHGVRLAVQNHHDIACGSESFEDLLREIDHPNVKAGFDAWAPALHGADIAAFATRMGRCSIHTTVADYQHRPRYRYQPQLVNYAHSADYVQAVPFGEGFIDYPSFFTALRENGYSGTVAYEMCSPILGGGAMENLDRYAGRFVEQMKVLED